VPRSTTACSGFTIVELIVVLTVISILALMASISVGSARQRAYVASMQSDLRSIAMAQEAYSEKMFAETGTATYAALLTDLGVTLSDGVQLEMRGDVNGWSARTTHSGAPGRRCAMLRGSVSAFAPAAAGAGLACD